VAGIYIRLFIANPGWVLRKPREFLTDLFECILKLMGQPNPNMESLEMLMTAMTKLIEAQPALSDLVPATGYLSRYLKFYISEVFKYVFFPLVLLERHFKTFT
jgi:DnaJ family protein C protein 13